MTDTAMKQGTDEGVIRMLREDRVLRLQREVSSLEAEREENEATIKSLRARLGAVKRAQAKAEFRTLIVLCAALAEFSVIALLIGMSL